MTNEAPNHRYGCRCPSCNEGTTKVPAPADPKIPIGPKPATTIVRTPEHAGMPEKKARQPAKRKRPTRK